MDLRENQSEMSYMMVSPHGPNQRLAIILYFVFKFALIAVSALSIWLGYSLFILGVTGEASLIANAKDIEAQLLNAAPGLFFALGGIGALIAIALKGVEVKA